MIPESLNIRIAVPVTAVFQQQMFLVVEPGSGHRLRRRFGRNKNGPLRGHVQEANLVGNFRKGKARCRPASRNGHSESDAQCHREWRSYKEFAAS